MRKLFLALLPLLLILPVVPGCRDQSGLTRQEQSRLELVQEIKAFEARIGFSPTENFLTCSSEVKAYDYYFYTGKTELPYSLDDPQLQFGTGNAGNITLDLKQYDVFFYSIEALAGIRTPLTGSLIQAPLSRFIHVVFHEDWHEQIDLPLSIEEPTGEVVSYAAAILFAEEKFGRNAEVYLTLQREFHNKLRESQVYAEYYRQLEALYAQFRDGTIPEKETLLRKENLFKELGNDLKNVWGARPEQLNNAYISFQMTYLRLLPLTYQAYLNSGVDLPGMASIFREMPEQGKSHDTLEKVKTIEAEVSKYLGNLGKPVTISGG